MLPALLLAPQPNHAVLDLCAAPGSKSCQILEMMEEAAAATTAAGRQASSVGLLIANDASLGRALL